MRVDSGEVFALLGPNGAGKSTTVEILEGHRQRTSGDVSVLGFDPGHGDRAYKQRIGVVLQDTSVERFLTVAEVIDRFRSFFPNPRPRDEIIEVVGLGEQRDMRVSRLSGGQQRRLDVAIGLAGDPDLLFLDEPTTGFDPAARRGAWDMVRNLQSLGKTIFLTTHYMDEAEHLAGRVAVIVDGRIVAEGAPDLLAAGTGRTATITFRLPVDTALPTALSDLFVRDGETLRAVTEQPTALLQRITEWAMAQGIELEALEVTRPRLEEAYLALVGHVEATPAAASSVREQASAPTTDCTMIGLAFRQVPYENKAFWRNPAAAFFTFAFPILFLVIFTTLLGDDTATLPTGVEVDSSTYYTASILAFAVVNSCYSNIAMTVTFSRDEGVLKRVRSTPMPGSAFLGGKVLHSVAIMALLVAIVLAFGRVVYDVELPTRSAPAFLVTLAVGSATFCALGLACTAMIPNAEAAPAIVNATVLPALFLSGVFIPVDDAPRWIQVIGDVLPIKPFLNATIEAFLPPPGNTAGWSFADLAVVAVWGVAGLVLAVRYFSWEPRR